LDSARDLQTLAEDLLDLARTRMSPAPANVLCDVADAVDKAVRSGAGHAAEQRGLHLLIDVPRARVRGRLADLSRLFRNLLDNAVEHAPHGTEIRVHARQLDRLIEVSVEDQGPGIPAAMTARLFEPFFRGGEERSRSGAGLGLAIAREIAEKAGGALALDSANEPTRFLARLPLADAP
jgi:two-component system sensor histidine kinase MprB